MFSVLKSFVRPSFTDAVWLPSVHRLVQKRFLSDQEIDNIAPRTNITCPIEQSSNASSVLSKFVTYSKEDYDHCMSAFVKPELTENLSVFKDYSLLVRRPMLEVVKDFLQIRKLQQQSVPSSVADSNDNINLSHRTVPRFVLFGQPGTGISVILSQLVQYTANSGWLIFPFANAEEWLMRCMDLTHSNEYHQEQHRPHFTGEAFDFPSRSARWLQTFTKFNEDFLEQHQPVTTREIAWTRVDTMPVGTPWTEVINFAIARTKYSTDCIGILLREMRALCSQPDGPPCLLVVDGVNFLWCRSTRLKDKLLQCKLTVDRLAIVHHLRRVLLGDWRHGAILTSLNIRGAWPTDREKYTPGYLLGKDGFECMDPFIPVQVDNYTQGELDACLRFYAEHHWLTNPAAHTCQGRSEIAFLSDNNPWELDRVVAEW